MTAPVKTVVGKAPRARRQASHDVYDRLKGEILQLHLAPGARLVIDDLAEQYGVSAMPIRQALAALELDELVEIAHHRGARVSPLSVSQLEVIQSVRVGLECRLTRLGVENLTEEGLEAIHRQLEVLRDLVERRDHRRFVEGSWHFRDVLYALANRPRLFAMAIDFRLKYERYLFALTAPSDLSHHLAVFVELVDLCDKGDADRAARISADSVEWTLARLTNELESGGRYTG